jgi:hypothetical protein
LNPLNLNQPTNAISRTVYASSLGPGASPVALADVKGVRPLDALKNPVNGIAVGTGDGGHLAWGRLVISGTVATTELFVGAPDGTKPRSVTRQSRPSNQEQRALTPFQWSADGTRLYYSREPVGLGGYILFGGMTDLWVYSLKDGKSTQLVAEKQLGGQVCIDDIAPNQKLVAFHCSGKSIGILDLATKKTSTIQLSPELPAVRALGNARFSADSARVAFAAARHDAENEQGWVLVSNGLTGNAKLIATSPAKDYYEVIAWLSLNTLLLQTHNPQPAVWTVRVDGSGLQKLSDGQFLSIVGNRP